MNRKTKRKFVQLISLLGILQYCLIDSSTVEAKKDKGKGKGGNMVVMYGGGGGGSYGGGGGGYGGGGGGGGGGGFSIPMPIPMPLPMPMFCGPSGGGGGGGGGGHGGGGGSSYGGGGGGGSSYGGGGGGGYKKGGGSGFGDNQKEKIVIIPIPAQMLSAAPMATASYGGMMGGGAPMNAFVMTGSNLGGGGYAGGGGSAGGGYGGGGAPTAGGYGGGGKPSGGEVGYGSASNDFFYQLKPLTYGGVYDYNSELYASSSNQPTVSSNEGSHRNDGSQNNHPEYMSTTPAYSIIDNLMSASNQAPAQSHHSTPTATVTTITDNQIEEQYRIPTPERRR